MISKENKDLILELTGGTPLDESQGVSILQNHLRDCDEDSYAEIDDIDTLIEIVQIIQGQDVVGTDSPFERTGAVALTDEWLGIPQFVSLKEDVEDLGFEVSYRKRYFIFKINGRVFFRLEGLRPTKNNQYSCKLIIQRILDKGQLEVVLDRFNLLKFKDREWYIHTNKRIGEGEAQGRYFFLNEVLEISQEISERL